jgi:hypothetical protein
MVLTVCRLALIAGFLTSCSGCATLINGRYQTIHLQSDPPGAQATVDGVTVVTPAEVRLKRSRDYRVSFAKEGYEDAQGRIDQDLSGYALLNGVIGILPFFIDLALGGTHDLRPELVSVTLVEKQR